MLFTRVTGLNSMRVQGKRARPLSPAGPPCDAADYNLIEPEWKRLCENFSMVRWQDRVMAVPLSQAAGVKVDESTAEAIARLADSPTSSANCIPISWAA